MEGEGGEDDALMLQQEELEALSFIYPDEFTKLPDVWGKPCVQLLIKPSSVDESSYSAVNLKVTFSEKYPAEP